MKYERGKDLRPSSSSSSSSSQNQRPNLLLLLPPPPPPAPFLILSSDTSSPFPFPSLFSGCGGGGSSVRSGGIPALPPLSLFPKNKELHAASLRQTLSLFLPVASQASRGRRRRRNRKTAKKRNIGSGSIPRGRREGNFFFFRHPSLPPASHKKRKGLKNRGRESVGRGKKKGAPFQSLTKTALEASFRFPKKNPDFANEISCRCTNQPSFPSKRQFRLLFPSFFFLFKKGWYEELHAKWVGSEF